MLAPLNEFQDNLITLIPNTGLQFFDVGFDLREFQKFERNFWEQPKGDDSGLNVLRALIIDEEGELVDKESGVPPDRLTGYVEVAMYNAITAKDALATFEGQWIPVPFLRKTKAGYAMGPGNWVRLRVVTLDEPDDDGNTHRATIAFETELIEVPGPEEPYLAPTVQDSEASQVFGFCPSEEFNAWWLTQDWVHGWLKEVLTEHQESDRRYAADEDEAAYRSFEHWARFLALAGLLEEAVAMPDVRIAVPSQNPIDVDLVLDIGNSRTCGLLIEASMDEGPALTNSYGLQLRDLTFPERVYTEPFETRLEFVLAGFGKELWSRRGGRGRAFSWPTVARIGPEATRLALASSGTEGNTGISSPKRYLWDTRKQKREWRFNAYGGTGEEAQTVTKGTFVGYIDEEGRPLKPNGDIFPAIYAHYSRSSVMMFAVAEVVMQAITQINSYARRSERAHADVARQLRTIILTMPTAMPLEERKLFEERAQDAVELLWQALKWDAPASFEDARFARRPPVPKVYLRWDEATCTQIVYLYSEIVEKFRGDSNLLFNSMGKAREVGAGETRPAWRLASLDIGGGTSDLIVTTYSDRSGAAAAAANIAPQQNFREGFNIAGDDILKSVIERCVIPTITQGIADCGYSGALELMRNFLGPFDKNQHEVTQRKRFAEKVLAPIALTMLGDYEKSDMTDPKAGLITRPFAEFFPNSDPADALTYLHTACRKVGVQNFNVAELEFTSDPALVDLAVERTIGRVIRDLCEIISVYDCDTLLLTGRPSKLPAIRRLVLECMPVAPGRIQMMHEYRVGQWYPFRDHFDRIADPKTTVAMGAMLCLLAQGHLQGFFLDIDALELKSTARFIGVASEGGQMTRAKVLFSNVDLDDEALAEQEAVVEVTGPVAIVFRQLDVERWPTTQLYMLEFNDPGAAQKYALPIFATITRKQARGASADDERMKENFVISSVEDSQQRAVGRGAISLRLQTLPITDTAPGYWLDTGAFTIG